MDDAYELSSSSTQGGMSYETDPVQRQFSTLNSLDFPCVYIRTEQSGLLKHKLASLLNLVQQEASSQRYALYIDVSGEVSKLGTIDSHSLRTLLTHEIFRSWAVSVKMTSEQEYTDDMRLAFCSE